MIKQNFLCTRHLIKKNLWACIDKNYLKFVSTYLFPHIVLEITAVCDETLSKNKCSDI